MNGKEIIQKIQSPSSAALFKTLYGPKGADAGKKRYTALIQDVLDANKFPRAEFPELDGDLRLFTAAGRTELGGNHTDHNRGCVVAASIQLDLAAAAAPRTDDRVFFRSTGYSDVIVDLVDKDGKPDLNSKEHEKGTTHALIRGIAAEFAERGAKVRGITVNADSTVLPGSGLSSSAAVEALFGRIINNLYYQDKCSHLEIAQIGQKAENIYFGKPCGLMDQIACAYGGAVGIDFADSAMPIIRSVDVDLQSMGYALCVADTRGSHANLTADYAAIPKEMKAVAAFFGKEVLRECELQQVQNNAAQIRQELGDRALLRALHFFAENTRAQKMFDLLVKIASDKKNSKSTSDIQDAIGEHLRQETIETYLALVNESCHSSWELLQNIYAPHGKEQSIAVGLALTRNFLSDNGDKCEDEFFRGAGACRVHGGGFAGTIQAYIPLPLVEKYCETMDRVFGKGCVTVLHIRPIGAEEISFNINMRGA